MDSSTAAGIETAAGAAAARFMRARGSRIPSSYVRCQNDATLGSLELPLLSRRTTLVLVALGAALAVGAIAGLLAARHGYEDALATAYELEASGARLLAAGLAEEAALRQRGTGASEARSRAAMDFDAEATRAVSLSEGDRASEQLVAERIAAQRELRRVRVRDRPGSSRRLLELGQVTVATLDARRSTRELTARQRQRRERARDEVAGETRVWLALAGVELALVIALAGAPRRYSSA